MRELPLDLVLSLGRVLFSTSLSFGLGTALAYGCHKSALLRHLLTPPVNFLRHISPFCWLPLIIMAAGIGEISVLLVLLLAMLFNAVVIGIGIFESLPRDIRDTAALDGARGWGLLRDIELPLLKGELIGLFRILWSVGWTALIAAEMLGVKSGLGYRLLDFRYLLRYREMLAYIALIGGIGLLADYLLLAWRRRSLR